MKTFAKLLALVLLACTLLPAAAVAQETVLRVGIIGLDTSHCAAFTKILNNPKNSGDLAGLRVVAAFPGGSPDIPSSRDRLAGFTEQLRKFDVEIVGSIDDLVKKVDVVLLESVDGRPHLQQVIPVLKAGKKVFIDKPVAGSLADALLIYELAEQYKVPVFSSSALRFSKSVTDLVNNPKVGKILGAATYGPCELESHHPDLFWYGIHGVEALYTLMGTGCKSVVRTHSQGTDVATGLWQDGRVGSFRGLRSGKGEYGYTAFGSAGVVTGTGFSGYDPLVVAIARFFKTGQVPVRAEETIEMFAFMEAADESKRQGGAPVTLESVLQKARAENARRKAP
jgi:predicted dehydrogenase